MDNRTGVCAVRSLPLPQRSTHAAFIHCVILSLCQLLKLNDDDDDYYYYSWLSVKIHVRSDQGDSLTVYYTITGCWFHYTQAMEF